MSKGYTQKGWRVSQVERLIDLPKRDIQRACYDGKGGASILQPANSTWGKRLYSIDDIAILMLVRLYKDQGYCLPEIRNLLASAHDQNGTKSELLLWKARLEEDLLEIELKLNRVRALIAALECRDGDPNEEIARLLSQQLPKTVIEALTNLLASDDRKCPCIDAGTIKYVQTYLDSPGVDLLIDLWAGPGMYDLVVETLLNQTR